MSVNWTVSGAGPRKESSIKEATGGDSGGTVVGTGVETTAGAWVCCSTPTVMYSSSVEVLLPALFVAIRVTV